MGQKDGEIARDWYVYLVECCDTSLYCGVTKNPEQRCTDHNTPKRGAKYTRARQPVKLVWQEGGYTKSEAYRKEYEIKRLSRAEKLKLIANE